MKGPGATGPLAKRGGIYVNNSVAVSMNSREQFKPDMLKAGARNSKVNYTAFTIVCEHKWSSKVELVESS